MDIRKYGIAIAVAVITAILIHSLAAAISGPAPQSPNCYMNRIDLGNGGTVPMKAYPAPSGVETNCSAPPMNISVRDACVTDGGQYYGVQGQDGCVVSYECSYCQKQWDALQQHSMLLYFYAALVAGLVFIVVGFLLPLGSVHEWVGLGFIIGGVFGLFIGTVAYWTSLSLWLRPLVIFIELCVVLFIIYKRMRPHTDTPLTEPTSPKGTKTPARRGRGKKR